MKLNRMDWPLPKFDLKPFAEEPPKESRTPLERARARQAAKPVAKAKAKAKAMGIPDIERVPSRGKGKSSKLCDIIRSGHSNQGRDRLSMSQVLQEFRMLTTW